MSNTIHRLLVTGRTNLQLVQFSITGGVYANAIDRRNMTILFTVAAEHLHEVLTAAKQYGLTVQQRADEPPWWPVVVAGVAGPWRWEPEGAGLESLSE